MTVSVNFAPVINSFEALRDVFNRNGKDFWREYCYHMVSLMIESEKILNGSSFSPRYVSEHCVYLSKYAEEIAREENRSYDR